MSVVVVTWDDLPVIPRGRVRWMDERQVCPHVLDVVHLQVDSDAYLRCRSYRAGVCSRAGAGIACAFDDPGSDVWRKAESWKGLPGGGVMYDPDGVLTHHSRNGSASGQALPESLAGLQLR
jgi:hypothetical protein